jgi:hypothetical protein
VTILNTILLSASKFFLRLIIKEMISATHLDTKKAIKPAKPNAPSLPPLYSN